MLVVVVMIIQGKERGHGRRGGADASQRLQRASMLRPPLGHLLLLPPETRASFPSCFCRCSCFFSSASFRCPTECGGCAADQPSVFYAYGARGVCGAVRGVGGGRHGRGAGGGRVALQVLVARLGGRRLTRQREWRQLDGHSGG